MMIFLTAVFAGGVRIGAGLFFIAQLLTMALTKKGVFIGVSGAIVIAAVVQLAGVAGVWQIMGEVFWLAFCARYYLRADGRMALFIAIFYEIAAALWRFLLMAGLGVAFRSAAFLDGQTLYGQAALWLFSALLLAMVVYVHKTQAMKQLVTLVVLTGFISVITLSAQSAIALDEDTLTMWTILAVILLMAILLFNMNRQYEAERELARLKAEQAVLLERDYTALSRSYAVNAKLFHDLRNHISALRQLVASQKYAETMAYLDTLQAPLYDLVNTVWTNDTAVDHLINIKARHCADNGIDFVAQVEFPQHTAINSADLCAILGNLLDNALEAVAQVTEDRFVHLTIRRINHMLVIKVENPFVTQPIQEGARLTTTKSGDLHGWGLASAQTAAEKYDGLLQTTYADHIFRAVVTLSYQGIKI